MQSIFDVSTYDAPMTQIAHDVFQTMLGYPISHCEEDYSVGRDTVTAAIFLAGSWQGAVLLECTERQAFAFTGRLMGIAEPTAMNDDVRDSLGEVINMIGGNLKSVLPTGVGLSIPSVLNGADYAFKLCGTNRNERTCFRGELGLFRVTLVQIPDRTK
jgi:chemotaxis protein CheX